MSSYKNDFNKLNYDRISLMVPKGKKEEIKKCADAQNMSINEYIWSAIAKTMHESDSLQTISIENRRFIGSKRSLIPFIRDAVKNISIHSFADIFAGTGAVANAFNNNRMIIINDLLYCNHICHYAWFSEVPYNEAKIRKILIQYNTLTTNENNYVTENYGNKYFSSENASKIGYIRNDIECLKNHGEVNQREYAILIMSLLYATQHADVSRTVGHYMTYLKNPKSDGTLQLRIPLAPSENTNKENLCYHMDALKLIEIMPPVDLLYLDPPYQRQYGEYYHVLESIALWSQEPTFGETRRIITPKSAFSVKAEAPKAFAELIRKCKNQCKYILVSDNNDVRNHLHNIDIMEILSKYGKTRVFTQDYPAFSGSKQKTENKERLFLCKL